MSTNWDLILQEGLTISIVGILIVFLALGVLFFFFLMLARILNKDTRRRLRRQGKIVADDEALAIPADHAAAISMALYLYNELHDEESNVLTIERVSRVYSPWSSKIYMMRRSRP